MFKNNEELKDYIKENCIEITDDRMDDDHFDIYCDSCKIVRGFQVVEQDYVKGFRSQYGGYTMDNNYPYSISFRCPVCHSYKIWIVFKIEEEVEVDGGTSFKKRLYKITSIPNEGIEDIVELPDEPKALREAYRQAIRSMDSNALLASAAMFRRALQVITRDIFGVKPGNLGVELKTIIGKPYNGGVLSIDFSNNSYIVKEVGNQGAHPDKDIDLLDFTPQDAEDLRNIFMEIVSELFVLPEAKKKAKQEFMTRRKIEVSK